MKGAVMRKIEVRQAHRAELEYLMEEAFHLRKMGASREAQANAVRKLARRQAELYPEVRTEGVGCGFEEEDGKLFIVIYHNKTEYHEAILTTTKESKPENRPYVGLAGDPGFPVIGVE